MIRKTILAFALCGLTACAGGLDYEAALSPRFNLETNLEAAGASQLESLKAEIEAEGYTFQTRKDGNKMTATLWDRILLPENWDTRTTRSKVLTLRHELVHMRQWRELGFVVFGASYLNYRSRWVYEMQGYRQGIRDRVTLGTSRASVEKYIDSKVKTFPENYKFKRKHRNMVRRATRDILQKELDLFWRLWYKDQHD